jgi:cyanobactin maturation PatA/PatG family protease
MQQFLSFFRNHGDASINVAILDGRVDRSHPTLIAADIVECPGLEGTPDPSAVAVAHGTFVASILFGQGAVQGIVPLCRALSIPIFPADGTSQRCSQVDVARSIQIAVERGAHVINISGGQLGTRDEVHPLLVEALQACERQNVLIVAAAGNDGCDCLHIPAAVPSTLAVGAMNNRREPLALSNWGEAYRVNGVLAPGMDVLGAAPGGGVEHRTGTSFATAMVSGFAALLLCHQVRAGDEPNPREIKNIILKTANRDGAEAEQQRLMAGRLDVPAAIALVTRLHAERPLEPTTSKQGELMTVEAIEPAVKHAIASIAATPSIEMSSAPPAVSEIRTDSIAPSGCGCGGGESCNCGCKAAAAAPAKPQLVYAIGKLGYDLLTEARRDSIQQYMDKDKQATDPDDLLGYVEKNPEDAERVVWTLKLGPTPIYAIRPLGAYAYGGHEKIVELFKLQRRDKFPDYCPLVAMPGVLSGTVRLLSGETVPVLVPNIRGITGWNAKTVIESVAQDIKDTRQKRAFEQNAPEGLANFLARVERQFRNLGIAGPDRALNYAATTAYRVVDVLSHVIPEKLELDDIRVAASAACRPGSECYDIDLRFFNPTEVRLPYLVFRFTIDVSDVVPVGVDDIKWWKERPKDR